jgi:hypothetical protein
MEDGKMYCFQGGKPISWRRGSWTLVIIGAFTVLARHDQDTTIDKAERQLVLFPSIKHNTMAHQIHGIGALEHLHHGKVLEIFVLVQFDPPVFFGRYKRPALL